MRELKHPVTSRENPCEKVLYNANMDRISTSTLRGKEAKLGARPPLSRQSDPLEFTIIQSEPSNDMVSGTRELAQDLRECRVLIGRERIYPTVRSANASGVSGQGHAPTVDVGWRRRAADATVRSIDEQTW